MINVKLGHDAQAELAIRVECPHCHNAMVPDIDGTDSWNENFDLSVMTVWCVVCGYTGSIAFDFKE